MNRKFRTDELPRLSSEEYAKADKLPLVVVLDNVRSGLNVGSVFRTSDALAVEQLHLCGITAKPPQREILKSAIGASDHVNWTHWEDTTECINSLKSDGYYILSVEQTENSIKLPELRLNKGQKVALVLGNEVKGVDQSVIDLSDDTLEIEQFGVKHSLNISVCAGIVIWQVGLSLR